MFESTKELSELLENVESKNEMQKLDEKFEEMIKTSSIEELFANMEMIEKHFVEKLETKK